MGNFGAPPPGPPGRFERALEAIDAVNRQDPRRETAEGVEMPTEWLYAQRLSAWVTRLDPAASEALRIAARGQHIARWTVPRETYPMDRGGYLRWREALKVFHAEKVGGILADVGYDAAFIARVQSLIRKKDIKTDPAAQTLEDALCLLFLETQFRDLRGKTPDDKMTLILKKTWAKMGEKGRAAALALPLPPEVRKFVVDAVSG